MQVVGGDHGAPDALESPLMKRSFVLTAVGEDRPGIVADLAGMIFDLGGNLEDSSMMKLGSEFAIMLLATGEGDDLEQRLRRACGDLEQKRGMTIFVRAVATGMTVPPAGKSFRLCTLGADKAGIVARSAGAVAAAGGNIVQLSSTLRPAAGSGTPLYEMEILFHLPQGMDDAALRRALDRIENDLSVEISLSPA